MQGVLRALLPSLILLGVAVGGCSTDAPDDQPLSRADSSGSPDAGSASGAPQAGPSTPGSAAGSPSAPTSRTSREPSAAPTHLGGAVPTRPIQGRRPIDNHLLAAARLPELVDDLAWVLESNGPEDAEPAGSCQKTSLETIGAISAVRRAWSADVSRAVRLVQVVARFADKESAWRANAVLEAWRADCEERLDYPRKTVGPLQSVPLEVGIGSQYAVAYGPKATSKGSAAGFGLVRKGRYLSILEITTAPEDWPSGWDPTRVAVRRIARTFS